MKPHYLILILLLVFSKFGLPQCSADISMTLNGGGSYTFSAINVQDTTAFTEAYWVLGPDTMPSDSNMQITIVFSENGNYQMCLQLADTSTQCSFDTCTSFQVVDAANYLPLLDSINIWHMFYNVCPVKTEENNAHFSGTSYYTASDTLVDSIVYRKFMAADFYSPWLTGFIREDTTAKKVYFRDLSNNPEITLYDFSMNIGDTIGLTFSSGGYFESGTFTLDSSKLLTLNGVTRRIFYLNNEEAIFNKTLSWIEGIGNLGSPVYPYVNYGGGGCPYFSCPTYNTFPYNYASIVTCFEHNKRIYYDSCAFSQAVTNLCVYVADTCNYYNTCGAIEDNTVLATFSISPNPVGSNKISLKLKVINRDDFTLSILSVDGKIHKEIPLGKLNVGTYTKGINIKGLNSGLYLVRCRTSKGIFYRKLVVQK